jgi:hypothetical protein
MDDTKRAAYLDDFHKNGDAFMVKHIMDDTLGSLTSLTQDQKDEIVKLINSFLSQQSDKLLTEPEKKKIREKILIASKDEQFFLLKAVNSVLRWTGLLAPTDTVLRAVFQDSYSNPSEDPIAAAEETFIEHYDTMKAIILKESMLNKKTKE